VTYHTDVSDDLTIDELARAAGTRSSTVRLYQTRGLLPPPEIRGRVGFYSAAHLARLRAIERLQREGYSLAAIRSLMDSFAQGGSLAGIVDPDQELASFGQPAELSQADFAAMFPDGQVDPAVVRRANKLGLLGIDPETGMVRAPSRAFVEIGRALAAYRVPPARSIDEFEHLVGDARRIARRFHGLFAEFVAAAVPEGPKRREAAARFRTFAAQAVQELVAQAIADLAEDGGKTGTGATKKASTRKTGPRPR
jgi:DNA-binding transcriptional MerR regulator